MDWSGTNLAGKTFNLLKRKGHMFLSPQDGITPLELFPRCIWANFLTGDVLNNVSWSCPSLEDLLNSGGYQRLTESFFLSFGAAGQDRSTRKGELEQSVDMLNDRKSEFQADFCLQLSYGCPNVGHTPEELWEEIPEDLEIAAELGVPVMANFPPTVPTKIAVRTMKHPLCAGIWLGNTIRVGDPAINWPKGWDATHSPLTERGYDVGGYSGSLATPVTVRKLEEIWYQIQLEKDCTDKVVIAGNSIRSPYDIRRMRRANGWFYGTGAIMRPQYMRMTIAAANRRR
jgi:hypothetical protein